MPLAGFHLHLYQPPREDPWLGLVANEWSAWPYHDWNERIAAECYRALMAVAVERPDGVELVEPLARSSFDLGPTLHHWLEHSSPDVNAAITHQARSVPGGASRVAIAMPLVHVIMPLATREDQSRLVAWGLADYRRRYGSEPRGIWLPETAVDATTLEVLDDHGLAYTVLMPNQARRVRPPGGEWRDVTAETLDTSRPYLVRLANGSTLTIVFGHHDLSRRVAFENLVGDGSQLADVMARALGGGDGMVLLVADGETYGHHHRFGDLGLAWAIERLADHYGLSTALGAWLEETTPTWEVELHEASAWSCAHGVERWRSDCGCVTGEQPGDSLAWRAPLRAALDWLRGRAGEQIARGLVELVEDPARTLDEYGEVIAGASAAEFAARHLRRAGDDPVRLLELCEAMRNLLYAFTSCAWFFADPGEIETSLALRYAAVAIEGIRRVLGVDLEGDLVARLAEVRSTHYRVAGAELWRRACDPHRADEARVAAGAAALFAAGGESTMRRGDWLTTVESSGDRPRVTANHRPTGRTHEFVAEAAREGRFGWRVTLEGCAEPFSLAHLGEDFVARLGALALLGDAREDYEGALNLLVAELLGRVATPEDEQVLVALASVQRCVTPVGEASIRRALLAISGRGADRVSHPALGDLARAVGLDVRWFQAGGPTPTQ